MASSILCGLDPDQEYTYNLPMIGVRLTGPYFSALVWLALFMGGSLLSLSGCSTGQVKLTETEQQVQKIDAFLSELEEAYRKKDLAALRPHFSPKFLEQHPELFETLRRVFEQSEQIQIDLTVDLIHIDGQNAEVLLHWDVNAPSNQGSSQHRGNTTLQLIQQEALQILALEGDNPFSSGFH